jgi:hypothetical protein
VGFLALKNQYLGTQPYTQPEEEQQQQPATLTSTAPAPTAPEPLQQTSGGLAPSTGGTLSPAPAPTNTPISSGTPTMGDTPTLSGEPRPSALDAKTSAPIEQRTQVEAPVALEQNHEDTLAAKAKTEAGAPSAAAEPISSGELVKKDPGASTGLFDPKNPKPRTLDEIMAAKKGPGFADNETAKADAVSKKKQRQYQDFSGMMGRGDPRGRTGTGWVNLGEYMGLNAEHGKAMQDKILGGFESRATGLQDRTNKAYYGHQDALKAGGKPSYDSMDAGLQGDFDALSEDVNQFGAAGGREAALGENYKSNYYGDAAKGLDAFLMGGSDRGQDVVSDFDKLKDQYARTEDNANASIGVYEERDARDERARLQAEHDADYKQKLAAAGLTGTQRDPYAGAVGGELGESRGIGLDMEQVAADKAAEEARWAEMDKEAMARSQGDLVKENIYGSSYEKMSPTEKRKLTELYYAYNSMKDGDVSKEDAELAWREYIREMNTKYKDG